MNDVAGTIPAVPPEGCTAYIVGPNHFQNAMLAAYIETYSTGRSAVYGSVASIPCVGGTSCNGRAAVLYDCFGKNGTDLHATLTTEIEKLPPDWALALFNLDRSAGIERTALELGVHGFFYQDDTVETLLKGLTVVFGGEFWVSRHNLEQIALENSCEIKRRQLAEHACTNGLTPREIEILDLLTRGASNEVIADKLFISTNTVRTHLNHIFRKIKVSSRLEASAWAVASLFSRKG